MASKRSSKFDMARLQKNLQNQFTNLDRNDPSQWPIIPRVILCIGIAGLVAGLLWYFLIKDYEEELQREQAKELALRDEYKTKLTKAINLDELKAQREQVLQFVTLLEKQLPGKAEMSALLSDINQAGLGRSLQFETFRPGAITAKDYYAEQPISIRVTGKYHDVGAFASDIANLSRIVTLNNLSIAPASAKDSNGILAMDATAKTFRYLDPEEIQAQKKAAEGKKKK